jgi:hypothetical protein
VTTQARLWFWAMVALSLGALAAAVALAPPASAPPVAGLGWLLFLGSSVHVASTGWLYTLPEVRRHARAHRTRYVWAPAGLIVGAALAAAVIRPSTFAWLLLPYYAWQFFHFHKQNLGMASLAASAHGVGGLTRPERRALLVAGCAGIAGLMARPGLLRVAVAPGLGAIFPLAGAVFAGSVIAGLVTLHRRPCHERPAPVYLAYLVALGFSLPVFIFRSPYAAVGGMTIAHGFQYLLLVALVAAGRPAPRGRHLLAVGVLVAVALWGGALLGAASHLHSGTPALRLAFGAYLGVVMAHFVVDAGLWRLREPFPRQFLSEHLRFWSRPDRPPLRPPLAPGVRQ